MHSDDAKICKITRFRYTDFCKITHFEFGKIWRDRQFSVELSKYKKINL